MEYGCKYSKLLLEAKTNQADYIVWVEPLKLLLEDVGGLFTWLFITQVEQTCCKG